MMTYTNPALLSKWTKRKNFVSFLSIRKVVDAVAVRKCFRVNQL